MPSSNTPGWNHFVNYSPFSTPAQNTQPTCDQGTKMCSRESHKVKEYQTPAANLKHQQGQTERVGKGSCHNAAASLAAKKRSPSPCLPPSTSAPTQSPLPMPSEEEERWANPVPPPLETPPRPWMTFRFSQNYLQQCSTWYWQPPRSSPRGTGSSSCRP